MQLLYWGDLLTVNLLAHLREELKLLNKFFISLTFIINIDLLLQKISRSPASQLNISVKTQKK